jgi:hypothetical protein
MQQTPEDLGKPIAISNFIFSFEIIGGGGIGSVAADEMVETWTGSARLGTEGDGGCRLTLPITSTTFKRACSLIPEVTLTVFVTTPTGDIARLYSGTLADADWEKLYMTPYTIVPARKLTTAPSLPLYYCERVLRMEASIGDDAVELEPTWWWCDGEVDPQEPGSAQSEESFLMLLERGGLFASQSH